MRCRITSMSQGGVQPPGSNRSPFSLETHRYPFTFDNHGNFSLTIGEHQHFFQCVGIIDHTDVFNRSVFSGVGLTGCQRMGSRVFAEDRYLCSHGIPPGYNYGLMVSGRLQVLPVFIGNQHIPRGRYCQCFHIDIG